MKKKSEKKIIVKKPTMIGRFVVWADGIEVIVGKKIILLSLMIGIFGFIVQQQNTNWEFFRVKKMAMADSELPQLSPKKEILADDALRCEASGKANKNIIGKISLDQFAVKKNIEKLVEDRPMENMVAAVSERDPEIASYLVAIAKKESNLGKFSPKKDGRDCYNYWGYRGGYNTTDSGYSCFDSPEQAVEVVGDTIQYLSQVNDYDTPQKMSVWKCGYDCSWDNPVAVKKWISDVSFYVKKINSTL